MADINLWKAYNDKRRRFGVSDSTNFRDSFAEAVNNAYADFNAMVFHADTLGYITDFDDIIDTRLADFTTITFDSDFNTAIGEREFWGVEYHFERLSDTNGFTDTITDSESNVVITITNGILEVAGDAINTSLTLPDVDCLKIYIGSNSDGNVVLVNNTGFTPDYDGISLLDVPELDWVPDLDIVPTLTVGSSSTTQSIATVSSHVISGISGLELKAYRFYSACTMVAKFDLNDNSATVTDDINSYTGTVVGGVWNTLYVSPSTSLDQKYMVPFTYALDYHLQNGGQWAIEPEDSRERNWYGRGIQIARHIAQTGSTYSNPLGI